MKYLIILALITISTPLFAGPFLDLGIGVHLTDYHQHDISGDRYLGHENPIGIMRIGYQSNTYHLFGYVDASVQVYWEHMSSAATSNDTGVDVLMFDIRFQ